ncbi:MAG: caspase family protein [Oligoflexus sp.]
MVRNKIFIALNFTLFVTFIAGQARADLPLEQLMEERLRPKRLVLSVGVDQFQNELWHDLRYAGKDAQDVYDSLMTSEIAFDGGEVIRSGQDVLITKSEIAKAFQRLEQDNRNEDDVIMVYISTHGTIAYKKDGSLGRYIITSDSDPKNLEATALDYETLMEWFQKLKSRKKVLVLAFCHSGVGKSVLTPEMKRALAQLKSPFFEEPIENRSEGSIILTASGWREPALEDSRLENDVYTFYLLKGFQQDLNGDGAVSITEAHQFAAQQTYQHTQGRQRPSAILELLGSDPIVINGEVKKSNKASLYSLMGRFSRLLVSVDGKEMGTLEKGIIVPEGRVRLTVRDPESQKLVADRVVRFEGGREYSIANYLIPRLPNNLSVAAESSYVANDVIRDGYLPKLSNGVKIRYRRDELIQTYDLDLAVSWFPETEESILSAGQSFAQRRTMAIFDAQLGVRELLARLSTQDRSIRTESKWFAGPSLLYVDRQVDNIAFEQRNAKVLVPGLKLTAGLDMILPYHLIKLGFEVQAGVYQNFAEDGPEALSTISSNISIGTFW